MPNTEIKNSSNKHVNAPQNHIPIFAIDASAGGLEPLELFFKNIDSYINAAFIIITHTHRNAFSFNRLAELLERYTNMKIIPIKNNTQILPQTIYVADPRKILHINHDKFEHLKGKEKNDKELPIDNIFRTLANDVSKRKIVGIILSGAGADGELGLRSIHAEGGLTIAEEPTLAKFSSMPEYAIKTGIIDYVLSPDKMSEPIYKYLKFGYKETPLLKEHLMMYYTKFLF